MASTSTFSPVSGPDSAQWVPSMPNSDLYTLMSVKDHLEVVTPAGAQRAPHARRVMAIRTSPLARFPPVSAASLLAAAQAAAAAAAAAQASTPAAPQALGVSATPSTETTASSSPEPTTASPRTRTTIGLGHPSTSSRRMPTSTPSTSSAASSSSSASSASPSPLTSPASTQAVVSRTRINSSTIKKRTERLPGRVLNSIAEDPSATVSESTFARPALGVRKRSYAAATTSTSTTTTDRIPTSPTLHTGRRTTPTSGYPRSAQTTPGNATATTPGTALPPRYTSLGTPQAGPSQVMSPRTLLAPYSGSPCFQSLDGAAQRIMTAVDFKTAARMMNTEGGNDDASKGSWREVVSEGDRRGAGYTDGDETLYREDTLVKLRYQTSLKMRVAARRLKTLF